jgi:hypothetical protein
MQVTVARRDGCLVVGASGLLDVAAAGDLRAALLKAAAEQPELIVCDLRDVAAQAPALTVLHAVADQVARWPSCPLVVLAPDASLRGLLERVGISWRLPVVSSWAQVHDALPPRPLPPRAILRLPPALAAPAHARSFLATRLSEWAVEGVDDGAVALVVDELVTNAVLHAGTEIDLLLSARPGAVRVGVGDRSEAMPVPRDARGDDEHGRGLALVATLTRTGGSCPAGPSAKWSGPYCVTALHLPPSALRPTPGWSHESRTAADRMGRPPPVASCQRGRAAERPRRLVG